jgi:L-2-hydroxyglutarate oxidase LhgO
VIGYPRKDSSLSYKTDITVIGAGVVGLAVAARLVDCVLREIAFYINSAPGMASVTADLES